ncbi:MAG: hypothetical protein OEV21_01070 [Thermoplasmata archaeon]|nr:hypothetical protein [Thermoplasmata archaeon]
MAKRFEMTYEDLMSIYRQESKLQTLSKVSPDFYVRVANYLDAIEQRCSEDKTRADISGMLLSQLKTAKEKSSGIYEIRMRKIALMAMNTAFGAEPRLDNATPEEHEAFKIIKDFFIDHRKKTMTPECEEKKSEKPAVSKEAEPSCQEEEAQVQEEPRPAKSDSENGNMILIRVLEDLPTFAGADKNYQLMKEDVVSLPKNIANILLRNNKAIEIKASNQ